MNTFTHSKHPIHGHTTLKKRFVRLKTNILEALVPIRMRRAIFASSLAAYLNDLNAPDKHLATQIGTLMDLTCDPASLMYPMQINHFIWKNLDHSTIDLHTKQCMTPQDLRSFCTDVITQTPSWLHYNTRRAMREDVYRLVRTFVVDPCRSPGVL